jgi:hypothetical protein
MLAFLMKHFPERWDLAAAAVIAAAVAGLGLVQFLVTSVLTTALGA